MRTILLASLMVAAAFAGCAGGDSDDPGTGTTTTTTTTQATTTTTTTLPVTTTTLPVNTTPPPVNATPAITAVTVLSAPDSLAAAGSADVCARFEGSGKVPHIAVHHDSVSHPNATSFTEYAGGATYPGGAAVPDVAGYALPGVYCFKVPVADKTVYFRAHALAPPNLPGTLSAEHSIEVLGARAGPMFASEIPEIASANSNVTICWRVSTAAGGANGTLPHTAIHWDTVAHPNATAFSEYKGGAAYPDNATSAAAGGYQAPGPFCTNLKMPASGAIYFRAHELNPGQGQNNISVEDRIVVGSPVSVTLAPAEAAHDSNVLVCWRVEGSGTIPHTAIHWDTVAHPNATAFTEYKGGAAYPNNQTAAAAGGYALPGTFCTNVKMPDDDLYFRAHALNPPMGRNEISAEVHVGHHD